MPPPGDLGPARITRRCTTWCGIRLRADRGGGRPCGEALNELQFLTIRRYLGFVFVALVILLLALTLWQ